MFPKPRKERKKKYSQRLADKYFSLLIRHRGHCQAAKLDNVQCGGSLQCAHIISRTNKRLRYDENNALCLCSGHHRYYTTHAAEWFWHFIPENFIKEFWYVKRNQNEILQRKKADWIELIDTLDAQLTALGIKH